MISKEDLQRVRQLTGLTLTEIGNMCGYTEQRVNYLLKKASSDNKQLEGKEICRRFVE